jgi:hypothetical protein
MTVSMMCLKREILGTAIHAYERITRNDAGAWATMRFEHEGYMSNAYCGSNARTDQLLVNTRIRRKRVLKTRFGREEHEQTLNDAVVHACAACSASRAHLELVLTLSIGATTQAVSSLRVPSPDLLLSSKSGCCSIIIICLMQSCPYIRQHQGLMRYRQPASV